MWLIPYLSTIYVALENRTPFISIVTGVEPKTVRTKIDLAYPRKSDPLCTAIRL
jgi:hypothetical protein